MKATVCFFWLLYAVVHQGDTNHTCPTSSLISLGIPPTLFQAAVAPSRALQHACTGGFHLGQLWLAMAGYVAMGCYGYPRGTRFGDDFGACNMAIDVLICFTESITVPFHYSAKVHPKSRLQSNVHDLQVQRQVLQNREATQTTSTIEFNGSNGRFEIVWVP